MTTDEERRRRAREQERDRALGELRALAVCNGRHGLHVEREIERVRKSGGVRVITLSYSLDYSDFMRAQGQIAALMREHEGRGGAA